MIAASEVQACTEKREQLSRESATVVGIGGVFTTEIVVQDAALGCFVEMRHAEIHAVPLDGGSHAADENHCPIGINLFDDPNMCKGIVQFTVSIEIPGVVEKHQISGMGDGTLVKPAVLLHVGMDQPHAVRIGVPGIAVVQVDAVLQEDGAGDAGAVISDAPSFACDGLCADELGRRSHNC